jgi:hypothetical protein
MRKKVNGEVAYGDIWPRKAEALFCLLRFTMAAANRVRRVESKLRSSNASMEGDVKKHAAGAAAHTPEVRSGRAGKWMRIR